MTKYRQLEFSDYLKELPPSILFTHLTDGGGRGRKIVSTDLIERIQQDFITRKSLEARFERLSSEEKMVCAVAYLRGAAGLEVSLFGEHRGPLLLSFLVYAASDDRDREFYFGFEDLVPVIGGTLNRFLFNTMKSNGSFGPASVPVRGCLNDFIMVLVLAHRGLLKRKKDGALSQASLQGLKKLLHGNTGLPPDDLNTAQQRIRLLLSFGTATGIMQESGDAFTTTTAQIEDYLAAPVSVRYDEFVDFAVSFTGGWSMALMDDLLGRAGEEWLSTAALPDLCRGPIDEILDILHFTDKIDIRTDGEHRVWKGAVLPVDTAGEKEHTVMVLPDFSAILPGEAAPRDLVHFSRIGSYLNLDMVYKGVIDRETVNDSLSRGARGEEMVANLESWRAPVNVVETVKEWIREFSRVSILRDAVLITGDEKSSAQVSSFEPLMDLIEPLPAHRVFTIKKGREEEVRERLAAMGFDSRMPETVPAAGMSARVLTEKDAPQELTLSRDFTALTTNRSRPVTSGKYSNELKELEQSEMGHVIDYALLMGHNLICDFEGSDDVKAGVYTLAPQKVVNGAVSRIKGTDTATGRGIELPIKQIKRIGVEST